MWPGLRDICFCDFIGLAREGLKQFHAWFFPSFDRKKKFNKRKIHGPIAFLLHLSFCSHTLKRPHEFAHLTCASLKMGKSKSSQRRRDSKGKKTKEHDRKKSREPKRKSKKDKKAHSSSSSRSQSSSSEDKDLAETLQLASTFGLLLDWAWETCWCVRKGLVSHKFATKHLCICLRPSSPSATITLPQEGEAALLHEGCQEDRWHTFVCACCVTRGYRERSDSAVTVSNRWWVVWGQISPIMFVPPKLVCIFFSFKNSSKDEGLLKRPIHKETPPSLQVRKRTLQSVRLDGSPDSLKLRLDLSQKLSLAERLWRDRLIWLLDEGKRFWRKMLAQDSHGIGSLDWFCSSRHVLFIDESISSRFFCHRQINQWTCHGVFIVSPWQLRTWRTSLFAPSTVRWWVWGGMGVSTLWMPYPANMWFWMVCTLTVTSFNSSYLLLLLQQSWSLMAIKWIWCMKLCFENQKIHVSRGCYLASTFAAGPWKKRWPWSLQILLGSSKWKTNRRCFRRMRRRIWKRTRWTLRECLCRC